MLATHTSLLFAISFLNFNVGLSQDFFWRDYNNGIIPCDAFEAAPGKYIGQVNYNGNVIATITRGNRTAIIEMYGRQYITDNVKILCTKTPEHLYWEKINFDEPYNDQMKNFVKGGYQTNRSDLFIGKAEHEGEWKVGKVIDNTYTVKGLWLWDVEGEPYNLREFYILMYEVLVNECTEFLFLEEVKSQ